MKKILFILLSALMLQAVSLEDVYHRGKIVIAPQSVIAKEVDFSGFDIIIPVNDDEVLLSQTKGKVVRVVNLATGKTTKTFTVKNRAYDVTPDNQLVCGDGTFGKIYLYDLKSSTLKKTFKVDYMFTNIIAPDKNTIIINAGVAQGRSWKSVVIKKDLVSQKEVQLTNFITKYGSNSVDFTDGKNSICINIPYTRDEYYLNKLSNKQFIVGRHLDNRASIYDFSGKITNTLLFDYTRNKITNEKKEEFKQKLLDRDLAGNSNVFSKNLNINNNEFRDRINNEYILPDYLPYYYNMLADSDDNILLFIYTEDNTSVFKAFAFDSMSKFIGDVEIEKNGYKINMNPKLANLVFVNNSIVMFVEKDGKKSLVKLDF